MSSAAPPGGSLGIIEGPPVTTACGATLVPVVAVSAAPNRNVLERTCAGPIYTLAPSAAVVCRPEGTERVNAPQFESADSDAGDAAQAMAAKLEAVWESDTYREQAARIVFEVTHDDCSATELRLFSARVTPDDGGLQVETQEPVGTASLRDGVFRFEFPQVASAPPEI